MFGKGLEGGEAAEVNPRLLHAARGGPVELVAKSMIISRPNQNVGMAYKTMPVLVDTTS